MFTQCPECTTVFSVDATTLARAHGCVCCSECGATFDSMATLCAQLPGEPFETLPINEPAASPPLLLSAVAFEKPPQQGLFAGPASDPDETSGAPGDADAAVGAEAEPVFGSFARQRPRQRSGNRRLLLACGGLLGLLLAQLGWAERASIVRNPTAAGLLQKACATLGCRLPLARDLSRLELGSRDVRRHPTVPGALLISATVHNKASFPQPWPVISIRLSDLEDHPVALRRFRPSEYLHDAGTRTAGLAPGTSAALVFEVADPGNDAVAFQFAFL